MCDTADEQTAHCGVDHGFENIEALFVVADAASISGEPAALAQASVRRWRL